MSRTRPLRIGILGAATIAPTAVINPARGMDEVEITAIAARDPVKAARFAAKHGIPTVHQSYEALLSDKAVDAIYNPLPNGLHGAWTIAALQAGKHVLCEKPFTANADEAEQVALVAADTGLVAMEAFHYRYHGLTARALEIVASGELGTVGHVAASFTIPLFKRDIRWRLDLAGGSLMDVGCYAVHLVRTLAGEEPSVVSASAKLMSPGIDRWLEARLVFPDGRTGRITAAMASANLLSVSAEVVGSRGVMKVSNPVMPHLGHSIRVRTPQGTRKERVARNPSSYAAQLKAFADGVLRGSPILTGPQDAIANMKVIDACYVAAGLAPREPSMQRKRDIG